jgi:4,5-dihydroxyphthalate decarboxylase
MGSISRLPVTIAVRDYDYVAPLALGDVEAEGLDLTLVRAFDALERFRTNSAIQGGEVSFSQYLHRIAAEDHSLVGLPIFIMREFRHRCFFVRGESGLTDVAQLAGRRVATDAWRASGNTWSRAILREGGVPWESVRWLVGPVDPGDPARPTDALPAGVEAAPRGRALSALLRTGEIDAIMCPWPPRAFYEAGSGITRLYVDYRGAEREYYRRTGIYPAHHVVALRRELVARHPWIVGSVFRAFLQARERSEQSHRVLHESSPWLLADLEEQVALMGTGFKPYGCRENRAMVAAFCEEQFAQGLIRKPLNPDALFAEFERLAGDRGDNA